jgi:ethanolamine permease
MKPTEALPRTLTPLMLWGLGVGYVISGMYFGWNLGLPIGGAGGMLVATVLVVALYTCFTFSYAELACAIPRAGGVHEYATLAFGPKVGLLAGLAQWVEFLFAPPAIAAAIGAYLHIFLPQWSVLGIAATVYLVFTLLNLLGVRAASLFELIITIFAVGELLLFAGLTLPHFSWQAFRLNAWPHGWQGAWSALPFALWFFLGLEGLANVAEETIDPQRNVVRGFGWALGTLVVLCALTFFGSIGVAGWAAVVYPPGSTTPSDSPLPLALAQVVGSSGWLYRGVVSIGLLGLVASFHGILLAAGRASFELGRVGHLPAFLGRVHPRFKTPAAALLANAGIGIGALCTGKTADLIVVACFGAIFLYGFGMAGLLRLRQSHPNLPRPFTVPFYPQLPWLALTLSALCLVALATAYTWLFVAFLAFVALAWLAAMATTKHRPGS